MGLAINMVGGQGGNSVNTSQMNSIVGKTIGNNGGSGTTNQGSPQMMPGSGAASPTNA